MSELILPGHTPPSGGLTILVPQGYETREEPGLQCHCCDVVFDRHRLEEWQRHVVACGKRTFDDRVVEREESFYEPFRPQDPEVAAHMRQVGKRMRKESRWVVKESEKAGFS